MSQISDTDPQFSDITKVNEMSQSQDNSLSIIYEISCKDCANPNRKRGHTCTRGLKGKNISTQPLKSQKSSKKSKILGKRIQIPIDDLYQESQPKSIMKQKKREVKAYVKKNPSNEKPSIQIKLGSDELQEFQKNIFKYVDAKIQKMTLEFNEKLEKKFLQDDDILDEIEEKLTLLAKHIVSQKKNEISILKAKSFSKNAKNKTANVSNILSKETKFIYKHEFDMSIEDLCSKIKFIKQKGLLKDFSVKQLEYITGQEILKSQEQYTLEERCIFFRNSQVFQNFMTKAKFTVNTLSRIYRIFGIKRFDEQTQKTNTKGKNSKSDQDNTLTQESNQKMQE